MVLMTEAPQSLLTPQSTPEEVKTIKLARKDAKSFLSNSEAENGGDEKPRRSGRPGTDPQLSVDTESDVSESKRKPPLMRAKIIEQSSLLQSPSDGETKSDRKKSHSTQFLKTNEQYHKIFKEISKDEQLRQSYTCALQKDILYQGKLYISDNWICFYSKVFGKDTKIVVPVLSVTLVKKTKTAILVPNAIVIATAQERHIFVSFLSRDATYKFLKSICIHLDGPKAGSSPLPSSADSSFRGDHSSLPLHFPGEFSDLDGTVRQRRQDMMESSSSGSQTPDYDKMAEFPRLPQNFLSPTKNGEVAAHADIHLQKTADTKHGPNRTGQSRPVGALSKTKLQKSLSLNTLLVIYLFLVCVLALSSGYMAFKILCLEQRLNSLGALAEYPHNENILHHRGQLEVDNAEIYGELSTNLFKLEKVQRNLRKLLEET